MQKQQPRKQRLHNVKGVSHTKMPIDGRRVLVIDDVVTTAAIVTEITHTLFATGAENVVAKALARTPDPRD